jgi:tetratricopeptide (TPR) repeat protein
VHFEMGHSDLFLQSCAKALSVDPLFAKAYFAEGALYSKLGKSDLAIKALKKGLKISDSDSKAHFALAKIYREQGIEEACIFEAMETIKHNPAHVGAHFFLGEILYKHGDYALALKKFNECLKLHSGLASLHNLQALCFRKVEYRLLEELKKNSSQQKIEEIAAFYFENQKYEMAISFLERLRRSYPHNQNVVMKLSQVYQHLNHWQQAYTCLKEFFNAQPHNSEMKALVKQAYLDYERHLQNNILKQPRAHESRVQLIHLYLMEERSLEALEEYLRYLDIFPADHLQKSNMQKIMQVIQEQNEKLKTLPDTHAIVAFRVAHLAMARGQYQQAYAVFEKLLASYPQDQGMLYGLIRSAYHEKQYEQALKACRQLKKINANYRYANQIEAEILKNQKNQTSESSKVDINQ